MSLDKRRIAALCNAMVAMALALFVGGTGCQPTVSSPSVTANPPGGSYTENSLSITLTSTEADGKILYHLSAGTAEQTRKEAEPDTEYSGPIVIYASTLLSYKVKGPKAKKQGGLPAKDSGKETESDTKTEAYFLVSATPTPAGSAEVTPTATPTVTSAAAPTSTPLGQSSADTTAPVAGSFLASSSVTWSSFTLNWSAASDETTAQSSLYYYVCSGANASSINTVSKCEAQTKEMDWTAATLTYSVSGKTLSTTYYYNVIARDTGGNKTLYEGKTETTSSVAPAAPTSISLSTDAPLIVSSRISSSGIVPTYGGLTTIGSGLTPSVGGAGTAGGISPTGTGATASTSGSDGGSASASTTIASASTIANLTVSATFNAASTPACSFLSPFASMSCSVGSRAVSNSELASNGSLIARGYAGNGDVNSYLDSSSIAVTRYTVKQLSNLRNNNSSYDGVTYPPVVYNNKLFLYGYNSSGFIKLFAYDRTGGAINQISNIKGNNSASDGFNEPVICGGKLFFVAYLTATATKLFAYDDSLGQLTQISNIAGNNANWDNPLGLKCFSGSVYFAAFNTSNAYKLYRYDVSGNALTQVSNTRQNQTLSDEVAQYTKIEYAGKVYFAAKNTSGKYKLYSYDPSTTAVTQVVDIRGAANDDDPTVQVVFGGSLYFSAKNTSGMTKLYQYTSGANTLVQAVNTSGSASLDDSANYFTTYAGKLFLTAYNAGGEYRLFSFDPSGNILEEITDTNPSGSDGPVEPVISGGYLYFRSYVTGGYVLYRYLDSSRTLTRLSGAAGVAQLGKSVSSLVAYNGKIFFIASNAQSQDKLFVYDPTLNLVSQVSDTVQNNSSWDGVSYPTVYGDKLYFSANLTGSADTKLFALCDLSAGCTP